MVTFIYQKKIDISNIKSASSEINLYHHILKNYCLIFIMGKIRSKINNFSVSTVMSNFHSKKEIILTMKHTINICLFF